MHAYQTRRQKRFARVSSNTSDGSDRVSTTVKRIGRLAPYILIVFLLFREPLDLAALTTKGGGKLWQQQLPEKQKNTDVKESPQCTREELLKVRQHLHPEACPIARKNPFTQHCSITQATKCVDATWLDEYYKELLNENDLSPFLGISVGCNKGFDALDTLRMGTFDAGLDKAAWRQSMEGDGELHSSVCQQNTMPQFEVGRSNKRRRGEMHCFEPMPQTYQKLKESAESLGYDKKGYKVVHAAVSKESGKLLFSTGNHKAGVENVGLDACKRLSGPEQKQHCTEVDVLTLQEYVASHIDVDGQTRTIHHLSIDVEGYDGDVILGTGRDILKRVEYLEFEYNWMGSWANQHLHDFITMLDGKDNNVGESTEELSFTCYWGGMGRLWRITNCWMRYYDIHTWSNVVCVNRKLVPRLATKMEAIFQKTILEERGPYRKDRYVGDFNQFKDDVMMIIDPHEALISTEYL